MADQPAASMDIADVLQYVPAGQARELVTAYLRAQAAERLVLRWLAGLGLGGRRITTVATLDRAGRPLVYLTVATDKPERLCKRAVPPGPPNISGAA